MSKLQKVTDKNIKPILLLVVAVAVLAAVWYIPIDQPREPDFEKEAAAAKVYGVSFEINEIKATHNLDTQVYWYSTLIERVGPIEAQEELFRSGLPFTGQTHLLNHTAGDYIFEQFGAEGLVYCKDYFLASCYHGHILHVIGGGDVSALEQVMAACKEKGIAVLSQCAHAVGHGFLAYLGYDKLPDAAGLCDDLSENVEGFPLFNCQDGVFMENIWAVHEGEVSSVNWLDEEDPIYPCNSNLIKESYKKACWSNQPGYLYQLFDRDLKKVASVCLGLENTNLRETCFNGLARQIHPIAAGSVEKTFQLCGQMPASWRDYCVLVNATSEFSVGGRVLPFQLCASIPAQSKQRCYDRLFGSMSVYAVTKTEHQEFCSKVLEESWLEKCLLTI